MRPAADPATAIRAAIEAMDGTLAMARALVESGRRDPHGDPWPLVHHGGPTRREGAARRPLDGGRLGQGAGPGQRGSLGKGAVGKVRALCPTWARG